MQWLPKPLLGTPRHQTGLLMLCKIESLPRHLQRYAN